MITEEEDYCKSIDFYAIEGSDQIRVLLNGIHYGDFDSIYEALNSLGDNSAYCADLLEGV